MCLGFLSGGHGLFCYLKTFTGGSKLTTLEKVREDLKILTKYYEYEKELKQAFKIVPHPRTEQVLNTYTKIIGTAPLDLYMVFYELYVLGNTQENTAEQLHYCVEQIRRKNSQLLQYFLQHLNKEVTCY